MKPGWRVWAAGGLLRRVEGGARAGGKGHPGLAAGVRLPISSHTEALKPEDLARVTHPWLYLPL